MSRRDVAPVLAGSSPVGGTITAAAFRRRATELLGELEATDEAQALVAAVRFARDQLAMEREDLRSSAGGAANSPYRFGDGASRPHH